MKKMVTLAIILMVSASVGNAANVIGLFNDIGGTQCGSDLSAFQNRTLYVIAELDPSVASITATEFSIWNFPQSNGMGTITANWNTPLVIGNLETISHRFAVAFPTAMTGPKVLLGSITFFSFSDQWLSNDHVMIVREAQDSGTLAVVDASFTTLAASGYSYTWNCTGVCDCDYLTPVAPTSWGAVKALY